MRFSPNGEVHVCCVNKYQVLGRVGSQTLREIWDGGPRRRIEAALAASDYSLGCHECEREHVVGNRLMTHAEQFDRFAGRLDPRYPRRVEFALSNACNLQCVMCGGDLSSSIRAHRERLPPLRAAYGDEFFEQLDEFLPHLEVAVFIGGEPFLSREARRVWDRMIELDLRCEVHVTTNGTIWNDAVEHYVRALRMNVAVSIDGLSAEVNDRIRVGSDVEQVLANRDRLHALTQRTGSAFVVNHCLLTENWRHLAPFLVDAERRALSVHVIVVTAPMRYSLVDLPTDELAAVVAVLEAQDADVAPQLRRNAGAWSDTLEHLRGHLRRRSDDATPVPVGAPARRHRSVDDAWEQLAADLVATTGRSTLAIDEHDGVITAVEAPDWADALGAQTWTGLATRDLFPLLSSRLGPAGEAEVTKPHPDITRIVLRFGDQDGGCAIVVLRRDDPARPGAAARYLLNTADPVPAGPRSADGADVTDAAPLQVRVLPSAYS
jgi:MoaA/NifB/PqqE/SkfB family radical SAM enzyme